MKKRFGVGTVAVIATILIILSFSAKAAGQWYQDVYGTTNYNGQLTLTSPSGSSVSSSSNPTGSNVNLTQTASVQPPVVLVQATTTLPIKSIGDACTATTTGSYPNQTATESIAITADRSTLLSCQNGVYRPSTGDSGAKAWVNFDGTNCPGNWCAIRSSYNVWGVYRSSAGLYTPWFNTQMSDANYVVAGVAGQAPAHDPYIKFPADGFTPRTNSFEFYVVDNNTPYPAGAHPPIDVASVTLTVHGH